MKIDCILALQEGNLLGFLPPTQGDNIHTRFDSLQKKVYLLLYSLYLYIYISICILVFKFCNPCWFLSVFWFLLLHKESCFKFTNSCCRM